MEEEAAEVISRGAGESVRAEEEGGRGSEHTLMSLGGCLHAAAGGQRGVKQLLNAAFNYRAALTFTAVRT